MDLLVAFGSAVRAERLRKKLTQAKLAELAGLHYNYVGLIERGQTAPALDTVFKLATALGRRPSTLLTRAEARMKAVSARACRGTGTP